MKKIFFLLAVLFIVNLACKKNGDGNTCACSPVTEPALTLVIKNAQGEDLLNPATSGALLESQVKLYTKSSNGGEQVSKIYIQKPVNMSPTEKFDFYQITSYEIVNLAKSGSPFYLKLGNAEPLLLTLTFNESTRKVEALVINQQPATKGEGLITSYIGSFFYIVS